MDQEGFRWIRSTYIPSGTTLRRHWLYKTASQRIKERCLEWTNELQRGRDPIWVRTSQQHFAFPSHGLERFRCLANSRAYIIFRIGMCFLYLLPRITTVHGLGLRIDDDDAFRPTTIKRRIWINHEGNIAPFVKLVLLLRKLGSCSLVFWYYYHYQINNPEITI